MDKDNLTFTHIQPLLNYFNELIPLNNDEKQLVTNLFKPRSVVRSLAVFILSTNNN